MKQANESLGHKIASWIVTTILVRMLLLAALFGLLMLGIQIAHICPQSQEHPYARVEDADGFMVYEANDREVGTGHDEGFASLGGGTEVALFSLAMAFIKWGHKTIDKAELDDEEGPDRCRG